MRLQCGLNLMLFDSSFGRGRVPAGLSCGDMPSSGSNSKMRLQCGPNLMLFDSSFGRGRVPAGYSETRGLIRFRKMRIHFASRASYKATNQ